MTDVRTVPWFCAPCARADKRTIRHAPPGQPPTLPCDGGHRLEWLRRQWTCHSCHREGRTTFVAGETRPTEPCAHGHEGPWIVTAESQWVFAQLDQLSARHEPRSHP